MQCGEREAPAPPAPRWPRNTSQLQIGPSRAAGALNPASCRTPCEDVAVVLWARGWRQSAVQAPAQTPQQAGPSIRAQPASLWVIRRAPGPAAALPQGWGCPGLAAAAKRFICASRAMGWRRRRVPKGTPPLWTSGPLLVPSFPPGAAYCLPESPADLSICPRTAGTRHPSLRRFFACSSMPTSPQQNMPSQPRV